MNDLLVEKEGLGDVHSNLEALTTVVEALQSERIDHWVQVGDIVGYGADPVPCMTLLRELECTVCIGNHDAAVVGFLDTEYFNTYARAAIEWTKAQLSNRELDYLRNLPLLNSSLRIIPSEIIICRPSGCMSTSFAVKSVLIEEKVTHKLSSIFPVTSRSF